MTNINKKVETAIKLRINKWYCGRPQTNNQSLIPIPHEEGYRTNMYGAYPYNQ